MIIGDPEVAELWQAHADERLDEIEGADRFEHKNEEDRPGSDDINTCESRSDRGPRVPSARGPHQHCNESDLNVSSIERKLDADKP